MPYYATNLVLQQAFRTAGGLGIPRQEMLDYLGIDENALFRPAGMVPAPVLLDAIEYGAQRSGYIDFGLRMGAEMPEGIFAGLAILLSHCRTIGQVADEIGLQFHVVNSSIAVESRAVDGGRDITLHLLCSGRHEPVQYSEMQVKLVERLVKFLSGQTWAPRLVRLPFGRVSTLERYEAEFRCPVEFGAGRTSFVLDKKHADIPVAIDRANLQRLVMNAFDSLAGRAPQNGLEFPDEVARVVRDLLRQGPVSSSVVAAAMNLSIRSIQRRLSAHGVTLRAIMDKETLGLAAAQSGQSTTAKKA